MKLKKRKFLDDRTLAALALVQDEISSLNKHIKTFKTGTLTTVSADGETLVIPINDNSVFIRAMQARREYLQGEAAHLRGDPSRR